MYNICNHCLLCEFVLHQILCVLLCSLIVQFKQSLRVCLCMLLIYASMENESECVWVSSDLYTEKQMAVIVLAHNKKNQL